jgi:phosphoribosylaminoimidazolecarboxamide formyltransferase/IMP cyclohydrolase
VRRRALISVTEKSGIIDLARALVQSNLEVIATSGTYKELRAAGIEVREINEVTGVGELAAGRVKSLHPRIFAGILATGGERSAFDDGSDLAAIDIVVVNLYPFESSQQGTDVEMIDIGGVALIRAAAKNFDDVTLLTSPSQYEELIESLPTGLNYERRRELAGIGFALTARYDLAIARSFATALRYGENPHQSAALISDGTGVAGAKNRSNRNAKALSYNNFLDADAAWRAVLDHGDQRAVCAIIKHSNPCGIARASSPRAAFRKALECDPVSSYGGVVASNQIIDLEMAKDLTEIFLEVIIAPGFTDEALAQLQRRENLRLLEVGLEKESYSGAFISGGILIQDRDEILAESSDEWELVSGKKVSDELMTDLRFAWRAARSVKSNAIVIARDEATIGIGMGQVSRVDAARLALVRGGDRVKGAVAASDAFFPFADGAMKLSEAGVVAIVQPGGSKRDEEVIEAISQAGVSMYFTHRRHFSH